MIKRTKLLNTTKRRQDIRNLVPGTTAYAKKKLMQDFSIRSDWTTTKDISDMLLIFRYETPMETQGIINLIDGWLNRENLDNKDFSRIITSYCSFSKSTKSVSGVPRIDVTSYITNATMRSLKLILLYVLIKETNIDIKGVDDKTITHYARKLLAKIQNTNKGD